jgi:undecaprenyl-diphosphatase
LTFAGRAIILNHMTRQSHQNHSPFFAIIFLSFFVVQPCSLLAVTDSLLDNLGQESLRIVTAPWHAQPTDFIWATSIVSGTLLTIPKDPAWFETVQANRTPVLDATMPAVSLLGDGAVHVAGYALLYLLGSDHDQAVAQQAIEGQIQVAAFATLGKALTTTKRPNADSPDRAWFTGRLENNSFPSGHSMTAFCAAAILGEAYHAEWLAYPLAGLVAFSRVYNQKHWPADVLAGAGMGTLIGLTVNAYHADRKKRQESSPPVVQLTSSGDGFWLTCVWNY